MQMEKTRKLNIKEDLYFEIIRRKTASLLASSCAAGIYSSTGNKALTEKMRLFGEKTGVAFQIKDDLFDYGENKVGKPTGIDIREKKMTLPLIYTLAHASSPVKRRLIYIVKNQGKDKEKVNEVIAEVINHGGIAYAEQKMMEYQQQAFEILYTFPAGPIRDGLEQLVKFTTERKY
jgi:octaprenyl-diphosphate synthase